MTTTSDGGPAFPVTPTDKSGQIAPTEFGMSLRAYFAAKAMVGLLSGPYGLSAPADIANRSVRQADALLAALESKP